LEIDDRLLARALKVGGLKTGRAHFRSLFFRFIQPMPQFLALGWQR
jgi:hypothetical protein